MNRKQPTENQILEVSLSRWMAGVATVSCALASLVSIGLVVAVFLQADRSRTPLLVQLAFLGPFCVLGGIGLWATVGFARCLLVRQRPLFRLDHEGITDFGLLTSGYGLIKWQDIEGISELTDRNGTWLMVKVNNFHDLVKRRNIFFRPLLYLMASFYGMFGGEIYLPTPFAKTKIEIIKSQLGQHGFSDVGNHTPRLLLLCLVVAVVGAALLCFVRKH